MVDCTLSLVAEFVREDEWALNAAGTAAGGETSFILPASLLRAIPNASYDLEVLGVTIAYFGAAKQLLPQIYSQNADVEGQVAHVLTSYTTVANYDAHNYTNLRIPARLASPNNLFTILVVGGAAALDWCVASMWGKFVRYPLVAPTMPVALESIKWPLSRRV